MSKIKLLLFSSFTGILLAISWPAIGDFFAAVFYALFPLLWVEEYISKNKGLAAKQVFLNAFIAFLFFNAITTYWIYFASDWGAVMAIVCNSLFMAIVFWMFHLTKMKVGRKEGYIGLVVYWLAFEYLHLNWELSWTWLTFGNVFANEPKLVQWYEYTGVLGGSLFVLLMNLLAFFALKDLKLKSKILFRYLALMALLVLVSLGVSSLVEKNVTMDGDKVEVVIVQPNIDPYNEKFSGAPSDQIDKMIALARERVTLNTDYLIFPETAIPEPHWEHEVEYLYATEQIRKLIKEYPNLKTVIGSLSSHLFLPGEELTSAAKPFRDGNGFYENYNSAIFIDSSAQTEMHIKSKLVLGSEKLPFIESIPLMKKLSINLGGTSGGYGSSESPTLFHSKNNESVIAPIICYESIYGEYVTEYSRKGANLFAIITNDGWWRDTPGYKQHMAYARLRAIENRRAIVRSANTGISAAIDQKGEIIEQTGWWEPATILANVSLNDKQTFYTRYGDFIGRIMGFIAPLMILLTIVKSFNKTGQRLGMK